MQTVVNSLILLSLVGVVLLTLAVAALLRDVRALQAAITNVIRTPRKSVSAFANPADHTRDTFVLAVSVHCPACEARARALAREALEVTARVVLLSADPGVSTWVEGSPVETVIDPVLLGEVGVDVTPLLLHYDADGNERFRRPVGSDGDLSRSLASGPHRRAVSSHQSLTPPESS